MPNKFFTQKEIQKMREHLNESKMLTRLFNNQLMLVAHRGMGPTSIIGANYDTKLIPENTLEAFKAAMIYGADGFELDVFLSKDNKVMVIHDNELWRNVYGLARDGSQLPTGEDKESFTVRKKNTSELKKLSVGPYGETIPTLEEVFELAAACNKTRLEADQAPIIINIEIKDEAAVPHCLNLIVDFSKKNPNSKVDFQSIYFCSFNHDALKQLKEIAKSLDHSPSIAVAIKTTLLFGDENVDKAAGFRVKPRTPYSQAGLNYLRELVLTEDFQAFDAILWDIYQPLVDLAKETNKELHASTSDFREYQEYINRHGPSIIYFLYDASQQVKLFMFKCDEIQKVKSLLLQYLPDIVLEQEERNSLAIQNSPNLSTSRTLSTILPRPQRKSRVVNNDRDTWIKQSDRRNTEIFRTSDYGQVIAKVGMFASVYKQQLRREISSLGQEPSAQQQQIDKFSELSDTELQTRLEILADQINPVGSKKPRHHKILSIKREIAEIRGELQSRSESTHLVGLGLRVVR